jgi:hypothetical protein
MDTSGMLVIFVSLLVLVVSPPSQELLFLEPVIVGKVTEG